uniref:Uncharacterized protein n=1 Tax=Glossina palpalis gambiensis TaxID=67801 RepID=A0A1B0BU87_9MUSC
MNAFNIRNKSYVFHHNCYFFLQSSSENPVVQNELLSLSNLETLANGQLKIWNRLNSSILLRSVIASNILQNAFTHRRQVVDVPRGLDVFLFLLAIKLPLAVLKCLSSRGLRFFCGQWVKGLLDQESEELLVEVTNACSCCDSNLYKKNYFCGSAKPAAGKIHS